MYRSRARVRRWPAISRQLIVGTLSVQEVAKEGPPFQVDTLERLVINSGEAQKVLNAKPHAQACEAHVIAKM